MEDKIKRFEDPKLKKIDILNPKELLSYAQDTSPEGRGLLAGAISDFFHDMKLTPSERKLTGEIMLNLVRQAEVDLREALSERLAAQDNIPREVINFLANDVISVAEPVLLHSPVLSDADLLYIIALKGKEHWRSIAKRDSVSHVIADRLVDTRDPDTAVNLVNNEKVSLKENCLKKLIKCSINSEALQAPLLRRPELDSNMAVNLYMCVSNELRREVTKRFQIPSEVIELAIEDLVEELSSEANGLYKVSPDMLTIARRFNERGLITADLMIKTLRRNQLSFFMAIFAERIYFNPEDVLAMIKKDQGRPFALACRSIGMMKSEFASMFLLSRKIRTDSKVVDQSELASIIEYFDQAKSLDLRKIMDNWMEHPEIIH